MSTATFPRSLGEPYAYAKPYYDDLDDDTLFNDHVATLSYGAFSTYEFDNPKDWYMPELLSGSNYSGDSVTVANYRTFLEEFGDRNGVHKVCGGHGTYGVAIHRSALDEEMIEVFRKLDDYPCIDEEQVSMVELEAEDEAWDSWAKNDYLRTLRSLTEEDIDPSDDDLFADFEQAREKANVYWENETGNSAWIDLDRVAQYSNLV